MSRPVRKYSSPKCFCLTWLVLFTWYRNGIKCKSITILKKINLEICEFDFVWQVSLSQMIGSNGFWPNIKWSIAQLLDFKSLFLKATQHKIIRNFIQTRISTQYIAVHCFEAILKIWYHTKKNDMGKWYMVDLNTDIKHSKNDLWPDELTMEPCCALKYYPAVDACQSEKVHL